VLGCLLDLAARDAGATESDYLRLVEARIRGGNLSERIRREVDRRAAPAGQRDALVAVYRELADCLDRNEPWRLG
jgi:hypothetical protein